MSKDDDLIARMDKNFHRCEDWEAMSRVRFIADTKFRHGDAYNKWQWPDDVARFLEGQKKPMLTINKTNVHCLQVINDSRQNKQGIKIAAVGENADGDAADILEGIIRHIEYRSNAQQAYDAATDHMVTGGWGYVRVHVDYEDEKSFDQDIRIIRVPNPLNVYLDPDIQEYDGSDARFAFVFEDMPRAEAERKYKRFIDQMDVAPLDDSSAWDGKNHVRVCEYFEKSDKPDTLYQMPDGATLLKSELPEEAREMVEAMAVQKRATVSPEIMWYLRIGNKIADRKPWLGKYIPIARMVGTETIIDGQLDRKGHVRAMIDAQKMYNFNSSGSVEWVAAQTKTPYVGPARAFEGYQDIWARANTDTLPFLPFNDVDDAGNPIARPERSLPPTAASGHIEGMKVAQEELMLVSGQYQAVMGAPSNETSGKAINARQRQGENATYHFIDHSSGCIRYVGRIVLDLIPKVYDVPRVLHALGIDGTELKVQMDPQAPQAMEKKQPYGDEAEQIDPTRVAAVLNPNVGRYEVISDVGPAYGTQRQEAFNALGQMMAQNKDMVPLVGDVWAKNADFPGSDIIAKRMKNMVPQQAQGGPSPDMVAMQQHMQQLAQQGQAEIGQLHGALQAANTKLADQARDMERKDYEAETNRIRAVGAVDPEALRPVLREVISQALGQHIGPLMDTHAAADLARLPPAIPPQGGMTDGAQ